MRRIGMLILAASAVLVLLGAPQRDTRAEAQLQAAINKETVEGDLKGAVDQYKKLAQSRDQAVAAKALLRMGECYEKLGDAEARKAYEQVLSRFSNQPEAVAQARARLTALGARPTETAGVRMREFYEEKSNPMYSLWNVTADGRFAAATDYDTGNAAVVDLATGKGWTVTNYGNWNNEKGYVDMGVISRDGKRLAFWHYGGRVPMSVVVVDVASKTERTVYRPKDAGWGYPSDWSPDGKYIALEVSLEGGGGTFALVPADGGEVRILRTGKLGGSERRRILFSPDGRYVAYDCPVVANQDSQLDIFVAPVAGGPESSVVSHPARDRIAAWAPDGSILFSSNRTGADGLYRIRMENGKPVGDAQLLRAGTQAFSLGVSASGDFYYSQDIEQYNAYVAAMDFETGKLLAKPEPASRRLSDTISSFSWSPDGKTSVYVHRHPDNRQTMLVREGDSQEERELAPAIRLSGDWGNAPLIRWFPDGNSVLARGVKGSDAGFFRIDLRTGVAALVAKGPHQWGFDSSPDGRYFFTKGGNGIARLDTTTSELSVIYKVGSMTQSYRLSPDGRQLVFTEHRDLKIVPADGGPARLLVSGSADAPGFGDLSTAWTPDGRYVLYTVKGNGTYGPGALWIVPAAGGEPRQTELTTRGTLSELHIHPDGKRFSYTLFGRRTEYWAMENFLPAATAATK